MQSLGRVMNPLPPGKRSDDKAILILLGLTGAGKTATLNFLFNRKDIITEGYSSQTSTIMEYNAKIDWDGDEYDLRIFDTPGFGDTRQKPQVRDARFIATFDQLLRNHEVLKSCYPTTVLLVAKFNDDRIDGDTSHFIQMLKSIDSLLANHRLLDKSPQTPNLIFVLTHTMSEDNAKLRNNPRPKIQLIEGLVKTFTKIPTPIHVVMAENKPQDYPELQAKNGFYRLPNGDYYPLNLFKKIKEIAGKVDNDVGKILIHQAFKDPSKMTIQLQKETELLPEINLTVKQALKILQSAKFNIENTWISREILKLWNEIDENFKKPYFNSLQITQSTFHRHKIIGENDIPRKKEAVLKLLMDLPINPPILKVVEKLGIAPPDLPKSLGIGCFYNIFSDCVMSNSPFNLDTVECTEVGFKAPQGVLAEAINENLIFTSTYPNTLEYYRDRLEQLNICEQFKLENFTCDPKQGYNIFPPRSQNQNQVLKLTGIRERRVFRVIMRKPTLTFSFRDAITKLPTNFSPNDADKWQSFFLANGSHVVQSLYAGGCVEVVALKKQNQVHERETSPDDVLTIIKEILNNVGTILPLNLSARAGDWEFKIHFRGGDPTIAHPSLDNIFTSNGKSFYRDWSASLYAYPEMLHSEIDLECITEFLKNVNISVSKEIQAAIVYLFLSPKQSLSPNLHKVNSNSRLSTSSSSSSMSIDEPPNRDTIKEPAQPEYVRQGGGWRRWLKKTVFG